MNERATNRAIEITGLDHLICKCANSSRSSPLIFLVHGKAGDKSVMWPFSKFLFALSPIIISPQAFIPEPTLGGWSWWEKEETKPSLHVGKESLLIAVQKLYDFIKATISHYDLHPSWIGGMGFSQGGAMLSSLDIIKPGTLRTGVLLAGALPPKALEIRKERNIANAISSKWFIGHGVKDEVVPLSEAKRTRKTLETLGAEVFLHADAVGHKVGLRTTKALGKWWVDL